MSSNRYLQAAGYSIASNIFVQVLNRGFTFVLGAITLKYLESSALLGIINVRLALLYTTIQFLSREPFRRACLGEVVKSKGGGWPKIVNTIWLGFVMSVLLSIPLSYIWQLNSPSPNDLVGTDSNDYKRAVLIVCLAVIIEMLAEPCYIYAQAKTISDHNPRVEVVTMTLKSVLTAIVTVVESNKYKSQQPSLILTKIAFCQLVASTASVVYSYSRLCNHQDLSPKKFLPNLQESNKNINYGLIDRYLDGSSLRLSLSFVSQTFLKQFLTEGERYVMTFFNVISLSEQGIYDVVNNLGALAPRLIFKPIEDAGYTLFSQTVSRSETLDIRKFYRVQENLTFLIKSMLILGLIILALGYNYVPLIVIYGGEKLNNSLAFNLMRWQLFYMPILAVNGVTESFTFAIMSTAEIKNYNSFLILFSLGFMVLIYLLQPILSCVCFIVANCLVMLARITCSYRLIKQYYARHGYNPILQDTLPSLTTFISLAGVFIFLSISQPYLLNLTHPFWPVIGVMLGGWCAIFIIHVIMCHEEALVAFGSRLFKIKFH